MLHSSLIKLVRSLSLVRLQLVPEPGQLVDVRQRRYVVVDITQNTQPSRTLSVDLRPEHLGHALFGRR